MWATCTVEILKYIPGIGRLVGENSCMSAEVVIPDSNLCWLRAELYVSGSGH